MLYIYTNPALTERLSARFSGTIDSIVQNTLAISYNTNQSKPAIGEELIILAPDPYTVTVTGIRQDTGTQITMTVFPEPTPDTRLGSRVTSSELVDPDLISGPGTNFPVSIRPLYIASDSGDKRYRDIRLGLSTELPTGVTIDFSLDQESWTDQIDIRGLPSQLVPYRLVYRRVRVSTQDIVDLSAISYKLEAEEFLNYTRD